MGEQTFCESATGLSRPGVGWAASGCAGGNASSEEFMQPFEGGVARVGDAPIDEFAEPGVADLSLLSNSLPVTPAALQEGPDFDVERFFHSDGILVKVCRSRKQHITSHSGHASNMVPLQKQKSINQVVAENLAYWVEQRGFTQVALAAKAGVSQKTVSNYLNPQQRTEGATGKEPSAKLSELARIADALGVEVWQLTRPADDDEERAMFQSLEEMMDKLRGRIRRAEDPSDPEPDPELADAVERSRAASTSTRRVIRKRA